MKDNYYIRVIEYSPEQEKILKSKGFEKTKCRELVFVTTDILIKQRQLAIE
jgi:DNA-directed RNA polymerase subunit N (RpoN/RPB10)